jgi:hypothetical protein
MRNQEEGLAGPSRLLHRPRPQQKEPTKLPLVGLSTSTSIVQTAPLVATVAAKMARSKQRQLLVCRLATRDALGDFPSTVSAACRPTRSHQRGLDTPVGDSLAADSPSPVRHARELARRGLIIIGSPCLATRQPRRLCQHLTAKFIYIRSV